MTLNEISSIYNAQLLPPVSRKQKKEKEEEVIKKVEKCSPSKKEEHIIDFLV